MTWGSQTRAVCDWLSVVVGLGVVTVEGHSRYQDEMTGREVDIEHVRIPVGYHRMDIRIGCHIKICLREDYLSAVRVGSNGVHVARVHVCNRSYRAGGHDTTKLAGTISLRSLQQRRSSYCRSLCTCNPVPVLRSTLYEVLLCTRRKLGIRWSESAPPWKGNSSLTQRSE